MTRAAIVVLALTATSVRAEPVAAPPALDPSAALREGNAAATAGDWAKVAAYVDPLFARQLSSTADLAEAHRLAGLAAFFQQRKSDADQHFLEYLRFDPDAQLDPALYPPEVIAAFLEVRRKHQAELRARRPSARRSIVPQFLPPVGQWQNGDHVKAYVLGGAFVAFTAANLSSYLLLRSWCDGPAQGSTCDKTGTDHHRAAQVVRDANVVSFVGILSTYVYGVYDGVHTYRRQNRERAIQPYVSSVAGGGMFGVAGAW